MEIVLDKIAAYRQQQKPHTWRTVLQFIEEMGFDEDEYFYLYSLKRSYIDQPIWDQQQWIAVFWVIGGSEGYYVHVEKRWNDESGEHAELILLGKFWQWERAQEATLSVQLFINLF